MRIGGQAAALGEFLAEILELLLAQAAFHEGARIHAGRGVALEIDDVAGKILGVAAKKMVEGDFVERGGRGEGGDVPADVGGGVGLDDHGHGVPTDNALDAALDVAVAGKGGLAGGRDGVDVGRGQAGIGARGGAELFAELFEELGGALGTLVLQGQFKDGLERLGPFVGRGEHGRGGAPFTGIVNFFF